MTIKEFIDKINKTKTLKRINKFLDVIAERLLEIKFNIETIGIYYIFIVYYSVFWLSWFGFIIIPCSIIIYYIFFGIIKKFMCRTMRFKCITGRVYLDDYTTKNITIFIDNIEIEEYIKRLIKKSKSKQNEVII